VFEPSGRISPFLASSTAVTPVLMIIVPSWSDEDDPLWLGETQYFGRSVAAGESCAVELQLSNLGQPIQEERSG
jgi:hypothetical protein